MAVQRRRLWIVGWVCFTLATTSVPMILGSFTAFAPIEDPILAQLRQGKVAPGVNVLQALSFSTVTLAASLAMLASAGSDWAWNRRP